MSEQVYKKVYSKFLSLNQYTHVKIFKSNNQEAQALLEKIVDNHIYFINYEDENEGFLKNKQLNIEDIISIDFMNKMDLINNINNMKEDIGNKEIKEIFNPSFLDNSQKSIDNPNKTFIFKNKSKFTFSSKIKAIWHEKYEIKEEKPKIEVNTENKNIKNYESMFENLFNYHTGYGNILWKYSNFDYNITKEQIERANKSIQNKKYF